MNYLIIIITLIFSSQLLSAKTVSSRKDQLNALHSQCMSTGAYDKMVKVCGCINKKIASKMSSKQVNHIFLAHNGKRNLSQLDVDEGALAEEFEALVSAQCMGQDLKTEEE